MKPDLVQGRRVLDGHHQLPLVALELTRHPEADQIIAKPKAACVILAVLFAGMAAPQSLYRSVM